MDKKELIQKAKDCLSDYQDRESDNLKRAEEAIKFRAGEQWPDAIKRDRENPNQEGGPRPCPVMDKTNQYVRQVVNEMRMNRAAIKVRPVDDVADPKVAEVMMGIIRHIEDSSNALTAYTTGGEHAIDGGFGYWRLLTEYTDPMSFDQDIRIKRITNRFSVALGPHTEPDGSDCTEALVWEDISREEFEELYPKAKKVPFEEGESWSSEKTIRVAEYMRIEKVPETIHMMPDGSVWTHEELKESGLSEKDALKTRETIKKKVRWYKITAEEILEEKDMLGSFIPVIKAIGSELVMPDGKHRLSGMVEQAMDPQRLHNFATAGFIEHVALAPRAPWLGFKGQFKSAKKDFQMSNRANIAVLEADMIEINGVPAPLPQRVQPAGIAPGWQQMLMNTSNDIESSIGMYGPTVGARSQEKSGVALQEQKNQGMVGNFHFQDNLSRSIQHTGRIIVEWIPFVYDTERVARIIGEDGKEEMAFLNPDQEQAVMPRIDRFGKEIGKTYNINLGKYDVTVSTGPSYTTKRQEAAENQIQLIQSKPELLNIIGDIMFKNLDWPGADKISKRLNAMLPPQIKQIEEEKSESDIDQKLAAIQQGSMMLEQKAQALFAKEQELMAASQKIQTAGQETGQEVASLEALKREIVAERKILSAEQARFRAEVNAAKMEIEAKTNESAEESEGEAEEMVKGYDSQIAQPMQAIAETFAGLAEVMAQSNQISVQNAQMLATTAEQIGRMVEIASRPKRAIFDEKTNSAIFEPVVN